MNASIMHNGCSLHSCHDFHPSSTPLKINWWDFCILSKGVCFSFHIMMHYTRIMFIHDAAELYL